VYVSLSVSVYVCVVVESTYGWIIIINEDIIDKLDNQRALGTNPAFPTKALRREIKNHRDWVQR